MRRNSSKSSASLWIGALFAAAATMPVGATTANPPAETWRYVLIVANNGTERRELKKLRYADDDGVQYQQLFGHFARRVELLTVLDDETQQLYPGLASTTREPTRAHLTETLQSFYQEIERERQPGRRVDFVFIYVGHGNIDDEGKGYVYLADDRLTRSDLFSLVVAPQIADFTHIIVDSCHAYSLVAGRGEVGEAESRKGTEMLATFLAGHDLEDYPRVGAVLATSVDQQTHEWSRLRAGVFSHQVRSALTGAADVNQDGRIEYSELAAFAEAANAGVRGMGKTLNTFVWPPAADRRAALTDLRDWRRARHLVVGDELAGHFYVERMHGERWSEFHKAAGQSLVMALPADEDLFLRDERAEKRVAAGSESVHVSKALSRPYTMAQRGALDYAFEAGLYALPYGVSYYWGYISARPELVAVAVTKVPFTPPELPTVPSAKPAAVPSHTASGAPWQLETVYCASPSLVTHGPWEHGASVRGRLPLGSMPGLLATVGLDTGWASLRASPSVSSMRLAPFVGLVYEIDLYDFLVLNLGVEAGDAIVALRGPTASADPTVPFFRARSSLAWRASSRVAMTAGATWGGYRVTLNQVEEYRAQPEFHVGVQFR